jgi:hypothetical protein
VAAGAALAVAALTPASHPAGHVTGGVAGGVAGYPASRQPAVQLTAWTVTRLADGNISVTIRELRDPAGLQSTLRAHGVPASVTFASQQNPACQPYPGGTPRRPPQPATLLLKRVFPAPYNNLPQPEHYPEGMRAASASALPPALPTLSPSHAVIVIAPSALPRNAGVQLSTSSDGDALNLPQLVYASPGCTGS